MIEEALIYWTTFAAFMIRAKLFDWRSMSDDILDEDESGLHLLTFAALVAILIFAGSLCLVKADGVENALKSAYKGSTPSLNEVMRRVPPSELKEWKPRLECGRCEGDGR